MANLQDYIRVYQLPTGRRMFAQRGVADLAKKAGNRELEAHARAAVKHDEGTRRLELEWTAERRSPKTDGEAVRLDNELDRTLGSLHSYLTALAGSPVQGMGSVEARRVLVETFPDGATTYTVLAFEEQASAVDVLLEKLKGPLAGAVDAVRAGPMVEALAKLNADFHAVLSREPKQAMGYDIVRTSRERGQAMLFETVARVLGTFPSASEAHMKARAELLEPVRLQNEDVRVARQRRREAPDVDPASGEVVATFVEPADVEG